MTDVELLKARVDGLEGTVGRLVKQVDKLTSDVGSNEVELALLKRDNFVVLTPEDTGFSRLETPTGTFFVTAKTLEPYGDGYKLTLKIGNPQAISYHDARVRVSWGRRRPDRVDYTTWRRGLKTTEKWLLMELKPAAWNLADLVLAPAKRPETATMIVELETPVVAMGRADGDVP